MKKIILFFLLIFSLNVYSQVPEPVSEQKDHIILYNGVIHEPKYGTHYKFGLISFKDGKIEQVKGLKNKTVPDEYYDKNTILINLDGKQFNTLKDFQSDNKLKELKEA